MNISQEPMEQEFAGEPQGKSPPLRSLSGHDSVLTATVQQQREILMEFREELDDLTERWKYEVKDLAEKVLNASLNASKQEIFRSMEEGVKITKSIIDEEINNSCKKFNKPISDIKYISILIFISSLISLSSVLISLFIIFYF